MQQAQGGGEISLTKMAGKAPSSYVQTFTPSTGTGTLDASRGSDRLTRDGVVLAGERDIFGTPWTVTTAGSSWSGSSWSGSSWSGSSWSGSSWSGGSWATGTWG